MQIEKFLDTAIDLKVSFLKAKDKGIYNYSDYRDGFQISSSLFQEIKGDRDHTIKVFDKSNYKYEYQVIIAGLMFFCLSPYLIYEDDAERLQDEEDV
ncbi:MAG: hypothetical protein WAP07_02000 [Acutalibacteraceae bacterium]